MGYFSRKYKPITLIVSDEVVELLGQLSARSLSLGELQHTSPMHVIERAWSLDLIKNDPRQVERLTLTEFGRGVLAVHAKSQAAAKTCARAVGLCRFSLS